jgi:hypothetical protein
MTTFYVYRLYIYFFLAVISSKLVYAILVAVKFVFDDIVKVRTVDAPIVCAEDNVIVVPEILVTKHTPTIPDPVIDIPTIIAALVEVITTLVDADVAVVDVAVVDDDVVRIIKLPVAKLEKPTR